MPQTTSSGSSRRGAAHRPCPGRTGVRREVELLALETDQLRAEVRSAGINFWDVSNAMDRASVPAGVPGVEGVGSVTAVGPLGPSGKLNGSVAGAPQAGTAGSAPSPTSMSDEVAAS